MRNIGTLKIAGATGAATSSEFINNACDLCTLQIYGTATALKVQVQGMVDIDANTWVSIASYDKGDLEVQDGSGGMTAAGIFTVDIAGIQKLRLNVALVSGGNVSVTAMFVDTTSN